MKNIFIIVLCALALLCSGCAAPCPYWRTNYSLAQKESVEKGKPLLVLITAPDCSTCESNWCRIFSRKEFLEKVSKDCIPLLLNCPYENPTLQCSTFRDMYDAGPSPSLVLIEGSGKKIATVPFPYQDTEKCLEAIRSLLNK